MRAASRFTHSTALPPILPHRNLQWSFKYWCGKGRESTTLQSKMLILSPTALLIHNLSEVLAKCKSEAVGENSTILSNIAVTKGMQIWGGGSSPFSLLCWRYFRIYKRNPLGIDDARHPPEPHLLWLNLLYWFMKGSIRRLYSLVHNIKYSAQHQPMQPIKPIQSKLRILQKSIINHDCYIYTLEWAGPFFPLSIGQHFRIV